MYDVFVQWGDAAMLDLDLAFIRQDGELVVVSGREDDCVDVSESLPVSQGDGGAADCRDCRPGVYTGEGKPGGFVLTQVHLELLVSSGGIYRCVLLLGVE